MPARIIGANLRDISYVLANLRPDDRREIEAQWPGPFDLIGIAATALASTHAYVVLLDGNPEAAFGADEVRRGLWVAWSWGTPRMRRAVPHISRFVREVMLPDVLERGGQRVEARPMDGHRMACRWLEKMGARFSGYARCWGVNGEDFLTYAWTRRDFEHVLSGTVRRWGEAGGGADGAHTADAADRQRDRAA